MNTHINLIGLLLAAASLGVYSVVQAQDTASQDTDSQDTAQLTVDLTQPGTAISPDLFGIFFEDINYAADGGLYAELVQNRSFEYSAADHGGWHALTSWEQVTRDGGEGSVAVEAAHPLNVNNLHYAVLTIEADTGQVGLRNAGYDGIAVQAGQLYDVSLFARTLDGSPTVVVRLESRVGELYGEAVFQQIAGDWDKYTATLEAPTDDPDARLIVLASGSGRLALDMISLFPQETFHNRPNGMRADLAQTIADLNPRFMRFPGGCLVHGYGLDNMYRWKDTIGPVEQRRGQSNTWQYHQSVGLGYFEYFQFCEDIGAKPVPVVAAGVCCQNSGARETGRWGQGQEGLPLDEMPEYIQEVLDLIEYANGPVDSTWGAKRAEAGHPEPFNLEYLGIGNEDSITPVFRERFEMIYRAVKQRHPEITVIGTVGPAPSGPDYEAGWKIADELQLEMVDEHYYRSPDWFLQNMDFYDDYDRDGSLVYLGEYAAHDNQRLATLRSALAEAAYMTTLERNGDVVRLASYAPLLGKTGRTQWDPDLIYFTNTAVTPTINYYVQQLFSRNAGDSYLANELVVPTVTETVTDQYVFLGTWGTQAQFDDVRIEIDGDTLVEESFDDPALELQTDAGEWRVADGVAIQSSGATHAAARVGVIPVGTNYTYTLRAQKTGGREGFLIGFSGIDDDHYYWWNIGGWGNARHAVAKSFGDSRQTISDSVPGEIETGRWYDIRIEVSEEQDSKHIQCYLDDQLIHDITDAGFSEAAELIASTVRDTTTGDIILKLVNTGSDDRPLQVNLLGAASMNPAATQTVLAGRPRDVNRRDGVDPLLPQSSTIQVAESFEAQLPANSLTVIRIQTNASSSND